MAPFDTKEVSETSRLNLAMLKRIAKLVAPVIKGFDGNINSTEEFKAQLGKIPLKKNGAYISDYGAPAVCKQLIEDLSDIANISVGEDACDSVRDWLEKVSDDMNAQLLVMFSTLKETKRNLDEVNKAINNLQNKKIPNSMASTFKAFLELQEKAKNELDLVLEENEFLRTANTSSLSLAKPQDAGKLSNRLAETYQALYDSGDRYVALGKKLEEVSASLEKIRSMDLKELEDLNLGDDVSILWNHQSADSIREAIRASTAVENRKKESVGGCGYGYGSTGGEMYPVNDNDDDVEAGINIVDKRIRHQKSQKTAIVREYRNRIYAEIVNLTLGMKEINKQLEVGKLSGNRDMLDFKIALLSFRVEDLFEKPFQASFIKKYNDSGSRSEKIMFMATLKRLSATAMKFSRSRSAESFAESFSKFAQSTDKIIEIIESFTEHLNEKFGAGDNDGIADTRLSLGRRDFENEIAKFKRFFYIAQVRENFKNSATETKHYGESYEKTLGSAIADLLEKKRVEFNEKMESFDKLDDSMFHGSDFKDDDDNDDDEKDFSSSGRDKIKKFLNTEIIIRENFYKVLQTVELYLQKFTGEIALGPEELKNVKQLLDGSQTITKWYDDKLKEKYKEVKDLDVEKQKDLEVCDEQVRNLFDNFSAIKSIMNAFMRIGDKLNGSELHSKMVISPKACFNHIFNFIRHSSVSIIHDKAENKLYSEFSKNYYGPYRDEYHYFVTMVKAMVAKIMAVLDTSEMFINPDAPLEHIKNIRMIVGGGNDHYTNSGYVESSETSDNDITIYPQATELYYRLPLLVEYYKKFFEKISRTNLTDDGKLIGMVPEIDGVFAGILKFYMIDKRKENIKEELNSDYELKKLIRHLNKIYAAFKNENGEVSVNEVAESLKNEINRRIGLVKARDLAKYHRLLSREKIRGLNDIENLGLSSKFDDQLFGNEDDFDQSGEIHRELTQMPSDKYFYNGSTRSLNKVNNDMLIVYGKLLSQFKAQIGVDLDTFEGASDSTKQHMFEDISRKISMFEGNSGKQLVYVKRLFSLEDGIKDIDVVSTDLLMFHETVVYGISMLRMLLDCLSGDVLSSMDNKGFYEILKRSGYRGDDMRTYIHGYLSMDVRTLDKINKNGLKVAMKKTFGDDVKKSKDFHEFNEETFGATMRDIVKVMFEVEKKNGERNALTGQHKLKSILHLQQILSIKTSQSNFFFDTKNYKKLLNDLLSDCKFYLEDFKTKRKVPQEIINKYEGLKEEDANDTENPGRTKFVPTGSPFTLNYIDEEIEKMFDEYGDSSSGKKSRENSKRNFIKNRLSWISTYKPSRNDVRYQVFYRVSKELNNVLFDLFKVTGFSGIVSGKSYDGLFRNFVHGVGAHDINALYKEMAPVQTSENTQRFVNAINKKSDETRINGRFPINIFDDPKYEGVLEEFPEHVGEKFPYKFTPPADPWKFKLVDGLSSFIAYNLYCMFDRKETIGNSQQGFKHMYTSLSDVPQYIKEQMKANLPAIQKRLRTLIDNLNLLRSIVQMNLKPEPFNRHDYSLRGKMYVASFAKKGLMGVGTIGYGQKEDDDAASIIENLENITLETANQYKTIQATIDAIKSDDSKEEEKRELIAKKIEILEALNTKLGLATDLITRTHGTDEETKFGVYLEAINIYIAAEFEDDGDFNTAQKKYHGVGVNQTFDTEVNQTFDTEVNQTLGPEFNQTLGPELDQKDILENILSSVKNPLDTEVDIYEHLENVARSLRIDRLHFASDFITKILEGKKDTVATRFEDRLKDLRSTTLDVNDGYVNMQSISTKKVSATFLSEQQENLDDARKEFLKDFGGPIYLQAAKDCEEKFNLRYNLSRPVRRRTKERLTMEKAFDKLSRNATEEQQNETLLKDLSRRVRRENLVNDFFDNGGEEIITPENAPNIDKESIDQALLKEEDLKRPAQGKGPSQIDNICEKVLESGDNKYDERNYIEKFFSWAEALEANVNETLAELADSPKFGETSENSIVKYTERHGKEPFTLLSNSLYLVTNDNKSVEQKVAMTGEPEFKLKYASRDVLFKPTKVVLENFPGVQKLLMDYNSGHSSDLQLSSQRYQAFMSKVVTVSRLTMRTKTNIDKNLYGKRSVYALGGNNSLSIISASFDNVDNESMLRSMNELLTSSSSKMPSGDKYKNKEIVKNIVDLNIIPFNINALMRCVPLMNIFNYAEMFDSLYLGGKNGDPRYEKIKGDPKLKNPHNSVEDVEMTVLKNVRMFSSLREILAIEYGRKLNYLSQNQFDLIPDDQNKALIEEDKTLRENKRNIKFKWNVYDFEEDENINEDKFIFGQKLKNLGGPDSLIIVPPKFAKKDFILRIAYKELNKVLKTHKETSKLYDGNTLLNVFGKEHDHPDAFHAKMLKSIVFYFEMVANIGYTNVGLAAKYGVLRNRDHTNGVAIEGYSEETSRTIPLSDFKKSPGDNLKRLKNLLKTSNRESWNIRPAPISEYLEENDYLTHHIGDRGRINSLGYLRESLKNKELDESIESFDLWKDIGNAKNQYTGTSIDSYDMGELGREQTYFHSFSRKIPSNFTGHIVVDGNQNIAEMSFNQVKSGAQVENDESDGSIFYELDEDSSVSRKRHENLIQIYNHFSKLEDMITVLEEYQEHMKSKYNVDDKVMRIIEKYGQDLPNVCDYIAYNYLRTELNKKEKPAEPRPVAGPDDADP